MLERLNELVENVIKDFMGDNNLYIADITKIKTELVSVLTFYAEEIDRIDYGTQKLNEYHFQHDLDLLSLHCLYVLYTYLTSADSVYDGDFTNYDADINEIFVDVRSKTLDELLNEILSDGAETEYTLIRERYKKKVKKHIKEQAKLYFAVA